MVQQRQLSMEGHSTNDFLATFGDCYCFIIEYSFRIIRRLDKQQYCDRNKIIETDQIVVFVPHNYTNNIFYYKNTCIKRMN
jgi:hypothetical protein